MADWVVAGLGPTFLTLDEAWYDRRRVVAVNDFPFRCDHLVVLDGPSELADRGGTGKLRGVYDTRARTVHFARLEWWEKRGFRGGVQLKSRDVSTGPDFGAMMDAARPPAGGSADLDDVWLPKGPGSPTVAASLAFALGAERIGVVGVDCSPDHGMASELAAVRLWWHEFAHLADDHGCDVRFVRCAAIPFLEAEPDFVRTR